MQQISMSAVQDLMACRPVMMLSQMMSDRRSLPRDLAAKLMTLTVGKSKADLAAACTRPMMGDAIRTPDGSVTSVRCSLRYISRLDASL